jgi:hypothetical protein
LGDEREHGVGATEVTRVPEKKMPISVHAVPSAAITASVGVTHKKADAEDAGGSAP